MIEAYFEQIEGALREFANIRSYTLTKKVYNRQQGCIDGMIIFETGLRLESVEVKDTDISGKLKYRYQCMNEQPELIFRYDNAPHHPETQTFPHHKHTADAVVESHEPTLHDILLEIAQQERRSAAP